MRYEFAMALFNETPARLVRTLEALGQRGFHIVGTLGESTVILQREMCDSESESLDQTESAT